MKSRFSPVKRWRSRLNPRESFTSLSQGWKKDKMCPRRASVLAVIIHDKENAWSSGCVLEQRLSFTKKWLGNRAVYLVAFAFSTIIALLLGKLCYLIHLKWSKNIWRASNMQSSLATHLYFVSAVKSGLEAHCDSSDFIYLRGLFQLCFSAVWIWWK